MFLRTFYAIRCVRNATMEERDLLMFSRFPNAGVLACIRLRTAFFASQRSYCSEDKVSVHAITALHICALSAVAEKSAQTRKKLRIA